MYEHTATYKEHIVYRVLTHPSGLLVKEGTDAQGMVDALRQADKRFGTLPTSAVCVAGTRAHLVAELDAEPAPDGGSIGQALMSLCQVQERPAIFICKR